MSLFVVSNLFNQLGARHEVVAIEENKKIAGPSIVVQIANCWPFPIKVEVPLSALAELSDAIMCAKMQCLPVDVSTDGLKLMKVAFESGAETWQDFIRVHTL